MSHRPQRKGLSGRLVVPVGVAAVLALTLLMVVNASPRRAQIRSLRNLQAVYNAVRASAPGPAEQPEAIIDALVASQSLSPEQATCPDGQYPRILPVSDDGRGVVAFCPPCPQLGGCATVLYADGHAETIKPRAVEGVLGPLLPRQQTNLPTSRGG